MAKYESTGGGEQAWLAPVRGLSDGFSQISRDWGFLVLCSVLGPVFAPEGGMRG